MTFFQTKPPTSAQEFCETIDESSRKTYAESSRLFIGLGGHHVKRLYDKRRIVPHIYCSRRQECARPPIDISPHVIGSLPPKDIFPIARKSMPSIVFRYFSPPEKPSFSGGGCSSAKNTHANALSDTTFFVPSRISQLSQDTDFGVPRDTTSNVLRFIAGQAAASSSLRAGRPVSTRIQSVQRRSTNFVSDRQIAILWMWPSV